jgi:hypothetical protein
MLCFTTHVPEHSMTVEAAWLALNYESLADYEGRDLRSHWIAVVGQRVVDDDVDPVALAVRVANDHGPGIALFASVVTDRLG